MSTLQERIDKSFNSESLVFSSFAIYIMHQKNFIYRLKVKWIKCVLDVVGYEIKLSIISSSDSFFPMLSLKGSYYRVQTHFDFTNG